MPDKLYMSHSLAETGESVSGSLTVWEDYPVSPLNIGDTFCPVPDGPELTVEKVSIKDSVIGERNGKPLRQWEITIEGSSDAQPSGSSNPNTKYSFAIEQDSYGNETHSGSVEITSAGDSPTIAHEVGSTITLPGIGEVTCTKISGSDSYTDTGRRKWTVVYEAADNSQSGGVSEAGVKYTLNIENNSDGVTVYSGSKEISCTGQSPVVNVAIGGTFTLPLIGDVTCTRIHSSNEGNTWSVVIEGSRSGGSSSGGGGEGGDDFSLPETETTITYEINGDTVRTVEGEFVALRRSNIPITKKTITVCTSTAEAVALPGTTYEGGIVTSENVIKETIKSNGVTTGSYYKHTIEVES